jgi:TolB protein
MSASVSTEQGRHAVTRDEGFHGRCRTAIRVLFGLALSACRDGTEPQAPVDPEPTDERLLVSSPMPRGARSVAYIAIRPGSYLEGRAAVIINAGSGEQRAEALVAGGLDPVALNAVEGDTIVVRIDAGSGEAVQLSRPVPDERSLGVVRTEPGHEATGIPPASRIRIVFSEPLDQTSFAGSIVVARTDGEPVRGATEVSADGLTATFTPSGDLPATTEHTIEVGPAIRSADGARMDASFRTWFRTGPVLPSPSDSFPLVPAGARAYVRTETHRYPAGALSRYVLHQDGTFTLQYLKEPEGFFEYTGRITQEGSTLGFQFDSNAGQWQALGTLSDDLLTVGYNTDMALSDFEDGVYRFVPDEPPAPLTGDVLAFDRGGDIYIVAEDGTGLRRLTSGEDWDGGTAWSPDGSAIAFTRTRNDATPQAATGIHVMAWDGTGRTLLSAADPGTHDAGPNWSPDGTRIAFYRKSEPDEGGDPYYQDKFEIYAMRADGTDPVRLTHHRSLSLHPAWSPDGRRIAYASWDYRLFEWTLRVMNADGGNDVLLTVGSMSGPEWSPDGTTLVFSGSRCLGGAGTCEWGRSYLFMVNADGTDRERVTQGADQEWGPDWSPDGSRIAFVADRCTVSGCTRPISILRLSDRTIIPVGGTLGALGPRWRPARGTSP